jgi:riboflavin synthase
MFTGLIREVGEVLDVGWRAGGAGIALACPSLAPEVTRGDSVCVDGVCLTAEVVATGGFTAYASGETLRRSTLAGAKRGDSVNLEPALKAADRLGGHMVQGHVEGVGEVVSLRAEGEGAVATVRISPELLPAVIPKGSIALSGISLTVVDVEGDLVKVAVVPTTLEGTTLATWRAGTRVNVETDLVGRYVAKYLQGLGLRRGLTVEDLVEKGF